MIPNFKSIKAAPKQERNKPEEKIVKTEPNQVGPKTETFINEIRSILDNINK